MTSLTLAIFAGSLLAITKCQPAHAVNDARNASLLCSYLTWCAAIARRYIECWILSEEVAWSKKYSHWLCWHDRIVLWRWEVRQAEGVPQHDIGIVEASLWIRCNPCW